MKSLAGRSDALMTLRTRVESFGSYFRLNWIRPSVPGFVSSSTDEDDSALVPLSVRSLLAAVNGEPVGDVWRLPVPVARLPEEVLVPSSS